MGESKRKNQVYHALVRALERYGKTFTRRDLEIMSKHCESKILSFHIDKQSSSASMKVVRYEGAWYVVAYDCYRKTIVTFLDPACVDDYILPYLNAYKNDPIVVEAIREYEKINHHSNARNPVAIPMGRDYSPPNPTATGTIKFKSLLTAFNQLDPKQFDSDLK